ncbi:hypothetical protein EI94DRAFT_1499358, partial [Lactarius quietus]
GVLHRDISSGNILRLREPIKRSPDVDHKRCCGFLIDGDHAIQWHEASIGSSLEQSGTLPFMSTHLLNALYSGCRALHTAVDDLESFLWVLVWSLVRI